MCWSLILCSKKGQINPTNAEPDPHITGNHHLEQRILFIRSVLEDEKCLCACNKVRTKVNIVPMRNNTSPLQNSCPAVLIFFYLVFYHFTRQKTHNLNIKMFKTLLTACVSRS
ncbi:hypothetical protein X975_18753, partial [Stegodyphus mimosarum]